MSNKMLWGHPVWSVLVPPLAVLMLAGVWGRHLGWALLALVVISLIASVLTAVHHAEVVARRVGEPFGTLILALAVTIIEVALIISMMLSGGPEVGALARDTVFAALMIVCNGVVGLCLVVGGLRYRILTFRVEGVSEALSVIAALATLTLVLPTYTITVPGPFYSVSQLIFAGSMSLLLYGVFVFVQTFRHRDYFLPLKAEENGEHESTPTALAAMTSLGLLCICLTAVVGLAKILSPAIEAAVTATSAPAAVVGIAIALLVLLPETSTAVRAAARNRMQTSLNLSLGSVLATIGLTIPAVVVASLVMQLPLTLGLPLKEIVLLVLTLLVSASTLAGGTATVLQGAVHLVLFAAFVFLAVVP